MFLASTKTGRPAGGAEYDMSEGITVRHARERGGIVGDRHVVEVTSGFREGDFWGKGHYIAKNAGDLETDSVLYSAWQAVEKIFHTRNDRLCLGFKEWRTVVHLMTKWISVTFKTLRSIHATNILVSSGTDVRASTPFDVQAETSNSNTAKFICA
jgi:hypothetical protein